MDLRLERFAVAAEPGVLGDVLPVDEHRPWIPVVHLTRQKVPALQQQDALTRTGERVGERSSAGPGPDDDHIVVLGHDPSILRPMRALRALRAPGAASEPGGDPCHWAMLRRRPGPGITPGGRPDGGRWLP